MLGRSRQGDKLSPDERRALEHVDAPKPSEGSQAPAAAPVVKVGRDRLTWSWTVLCPGCGFKCKGNGVPKSGQRLAWCGQCRRRLVLA